MNAYRRKVALAAGIALTVFGLVNVWAARLMPPPADCSFHMRNPYRFRDWKNYLAGIRKLDRTACVVLISDSQGYAGEYPARKGYAARLEELLNARQTAGKTSWKVVNLSIDGVTPIEYMAIAAFLREERPLWLISVSGSADYRAENFDKGFSYPRTDLPGMLTEPQLAGRVPAAFWRRHGRIEDTLAAGISHRLPVLRGRDCLWSWLDTRYPGAQLAFYAPMTSFRLWQLPGRARTQTVKQLAPNPGDGRIDLTYDERSSLMLEEFVAQLAQIPAAHRLVAAAPLAEDFGDTPDGLWIARFRQDLARLTDANGLPFRDLTDALPGEDFITSNHFHDRNHRKMAELLADHIAAETGN